MKYQILVMYPSEYYPDLDAVLEKATRLSDSSGLGGSLRYLSWNATSLPRAMELFRKLRKALLRKFRFAARENGVRGRNVLLGVMDQYFDEMGFVTRAVNPRKHHRPITDESKRFGSRLKKRRQNAAMTQAQLAKRLGCSRSLVAQVETGRMYFESAEQRQTWQREIR